MKKFLPALLTFLFLPLAQAASDPQDLLEPDQAFALTVKARDADTIEASWKIAPGYYLYRDKFKFESLDPALVLKPAVLPAGKVKNDPTFGRIETYSHDVAVRLPFERTGDARRARLRITAQGCNEPVGVCYPPIVKEVEVELLPPGAAPAVRLNTLKDLVNLTGPRTSEQEFLPPDEAFALTTEVSGANAVTANVRIAPGYYLYRDKTAVRLVRGDGVKLGKVEISRGETKNDPTFGKVEVLHNEMVVRVPIERTRREPTVVDLEVSYQGCAEKGICYPPQKKTVSLKLPAAGEAAAVTTAAIASPAVQGNSYWSYILAAFGAGLLLTFTPCVLPMIPILSGIIVRSGDQTLSKTRGGLLSYSYVLGTAVTYAIAGALAGATGEQLQSYFQNPLAIGTFATVLFLLALSMFGLYELQMPGFIQSKLHYHSHKIKGGSFVGAFVLGLVSALIVGACVSPVLISVLAVALANKDPWLGGGILFALAHGQGVILVAVGVGAGFLLPRAGAWMDRVKYVFGVMLIGVAISLLGYLPAVPVLLLWAVLLIVTSVYMGATQSLPHDVSGWRYLWKGVGTFLLIWGALALLGGLMGERDILRPVPLHNLTTFATGTTATATGAPADDPAFQRYARLADIDAALASAKSAGRPVLIDFYASWCTDCVRMEKTTFTDPRVREAFRRFTLVQADVTNNDAASSAIKQRFGVFGPPAMLLLAADGTERKDLRVYGFRTVDELLALLGKV